MRSRSRPNLFGAWSLVRSWGRIGTPGQQRIDWHDTRDAAEQACGRLVQAKQRRSRACAPESARTAASLTIHVVAPIVEG
jgi:predicted DNA-binding WGR domain protein